MFELLYAGLSDIGRKRSQNQDRLALSPEMGLFLVADGMGGHLGGETASRIAAEVIPERIQKARKKKNFDAAAALSAAIRDANTEIYKVAQKDAQLNGMGTTATAALFDEDRLLIGHVGDSRCYFARPGALWQATRDHSLVQEKLRAGLITRNELKTDRMKNVITRSVGFDRDVMVELYSLAPQEGDCFVLCSDGLSGLIDDNQLAHVLETSGAWKAQDPAAMESVARELIAAANARGGDDNITAIVVRVGKHTRRKT